MPISVFVESGSASCSDELPGPVGVIFIIKVNTNVCFLVCFYPFSSLVPSLLSSEYYICSLPSCCDLGLNYARAGAVYVAGPAWKVELFKWLRILCEERSDGFTSLLR